MICKYYVQHFETIKDFYRCPVGITRKALHGLLVAGMLLIRRQQFSHVYPLHCQHREAKLAASLKN